MNRRCKLSLPSRERGLKSERRTQYLFQYVAPFAGAWIEISFKLNCCPVSAVAPFAGAWIEINQERTYITAEKSRSLRGSVD